MVNPPLFQFRLRPLEEVEPWGEDPPALHWFGLSDGWCWWQAGPPQLFRYAPPAAPYVAYQVVRPWEDLLDRLPDILAPVPDDLAGRLRDPEEWQRLTDTAWALIETRDDDGLWDLLNSAFLWWSERTWDAGYLSHPPKIWLWTQGDTFQLQWDNRAVLVAGLPVWDATHGEITMPVSAFVDEVTSFHERFMAAMAERVAAVRAGGLRPEIAIDLDRLAQEQSERATWLTNALARKPPEQDWDKVRAAINEAERMCYNNRVEGL